MIRVQLRLCFCRGAPFVCLGGELRGGRVWVVGRSVRFLCDGWLRVRRRQRLGDLRCRWDRSQTRVVGHRRMHCMNRLAAIWAGRPADSASATDCSTCFARDRIRGMRRGSRHSLKRLPVSARWRVWRVAMRCAFAALAAVGFALRRPNSDVGQLKLVTTKHRAFAARRRFATLWIRAERPRGGGVGDVGREWFDHAACCTAGSTICPPVASWPGAAPLVQRGTAARGTGVKVRKLP